MKAIKLSLDSTDKINKKMSREGFNGASWSDDDIASVRKEIKEFYIQEQNYTCVYCKQVFKSKYGRVWDVEHIISRESVCEFMFEPLNLCVACPECNQRKGNGKVTNSTAKKNLPVGSEQYSIVHPHFDNYQDHIEAIKPGEFYFSKTKKGECTIALCGLNRFYEYGGYTPAVAANDMIFHYASLLSSTDNEDKVKFLLREISFLALKQLVADEGAK